MNNASKATLASILAGGCVSIVVPLVVIALSTKSHLVAVTAFCLLVGCIVGIVVGLIMWSKYRVKMVIDQIKERGPIATIHLKEDGSVDVEDHRQQFEEKIK